MMERAPVAKTDSPSRAVVEAVADHEGVDPVDLKPSLYDAVDPEALDAMFRGAATDAGEATPEVEFTYHGHRVRVSADGSVSLSR